MSTVNKSKLRDMLTEKAERMREEVRYMLTLQELNNDGDFTELLERMERDLTELDRLLYTKF